MKCPTCGHDPDQPRKAARSRWAGMTKEQRSAEMSRIRKKGVKNKKARKRQPQTHNTSVSGPYPPSAGQPSKSTVSGG